MAGKRPQRELTQSNQGVLVEVDRNLERIRPYVILLGQHWITKIRADLKSVERQRRESSSCSQAAAAR